MSYPEELRDYQAAGKMSELYGGEVWVWGLNCCTCWFLGVIWSELWSDLLLETSYANASLQDFLGWKKRFNVTRIMSCPSLALQESTRNLPGNLAWNHGRQRDGWGLFQTWWEALLLCPQLFVWDPKKSSSMKRMYFFIVAGEQMNRLHTGLGLGWWKLLKTFDKRSSPNELRTLNMKAAMLPFRIEALAIPKTHDLHVGYLHRCKNDVNGYYDDMMCILVFGYCLIAVYVSYLPYS